MSVKQSHTEVKPSLESCQAAACIYCGRVISPEFVTCESCHGSYVPRRRPSDALYLSPNGCKSAGNADFNRKRARFVVRAFRGVACGIAKGSRFRWFVLTESDAAVKAGLDFGRQFHHLVGYLRDVHKLDFQYIVVEHRQGDKQRRNWHILSYGSDKLPVKAIRSYWISRFESTVTGMAEVADIDKAVKYLAGYLSGSDKFVRSFSSQGWVYRGWVGQSKLYRKAYGDYPSLAVVKALSLMSPRLLSGELDWLQNTGYLSEHYEAGQAGKQA